MTTLRSSLFILSLLTLFASCDPNRVYDDNQDVPGYIWNGDFKPSFTVQIDDTVAHYNIYINVRHTTFYQFSNLWIMTTTIFPDGKKLDKRVELELADTDGRWYSDCLGDICDIQIQIQKNAIFQTPGSYTFQFEQIMRKENLPFVMSMGLRVEKVAE